MNNLSDNHLSEQDIENVLDAFESNISGLTTQHHTLGHWGVSPINLVEVRANDGFRVVLGGTGDTEADAQENFVKEATSPGQVITLSRQGHDYNYGWDGEAFIKLPDINGPIEFDDVLNNLAAQRAHVDRLNNKKA